MSKITYIDEADIKNKKILLRVDFNVSFSKDKREITDDTRIRESLPTINFLLKNNNKLTVITHLGRPKSPDPQFSLDIVARKLQQYLPDYQVVLIKDFLKKFPKNQDDKQIFILENIRFYPEEKSHDENFLAKLASFGEVYVNDAFGVCHRKTVSVVDLPKKMPAFGGLLLKKEIDALKPVISNPQKPFVTIIGGAKISTKINLLKRLGEISDKLLIGGALANTFIAAKGEPVGQSFYEPDQLDTARQLESEINKNGQKLILPRDFIWADEKILDIGPKSQEIFKSIIAQAKTVIWNGPVGYFEDPRFTSGSQAILDVIVANTNAYSVVGGGDTLAFVKGKPNLDKISHISTGGGAMLEFLEKGTLPGIEALKQ